ncbi:amidohydrolase/deacetylase family metallohydrolase [Paracoccus sp. MBLB3053]|uniref:Amidohydrolase/deacetylase family metallohydrolase n=1 Tax=Paracoccus aurantius TaxID=3073814 RepID=A0ABU2HXT3_9RHOB|nr:amidohydrolase family protein [Paracoccus sp. MBLB3053]MDS9469355.1 amidohydrolase/deacetylase family metallohydrolase [Paracoccus sp. MBLB3053]
MPLTLTNFRAVELPGLPGTIHVGDDGLIRPEAQPGAEIIDCEGAFLSPGWCDLHTHIWHGGTDISVRPSEAGRGSGVTAMADAGSAGEANFHGLREYIIEPSAETIRAFVNIGSIGLVACNRVSELQGMSSIDVDRTLEVIEANRDVICGIKVRASGVIVGSWGITPAKIAKRVAEIAKLPLMVHVGEMPPLLDEVFDILGPGDIVTHCFNGKKAGSIRDTDALFDQAVQLSRRGVRMDIGHGQASFSFETARGSIADGLRPWSISTDLHLRNIRGSVKDMPTTASKLMAVGLSFGDTIRAITINPRETLGITLAPRIGDRADFTLFRLDDISHEVIDSQGASLVLEKMLEPVATVLGDSHMAAARRLE